VSNIELTLLSKVGAYLLEKTKEIRMNPRRFFVPTCLLAVAGFAPLAVSAQSSWYVGASAGQSSIDATSADVESGFLADDGFIARNTTLDKTDAGGKAYLGYRFNRFLAAEGGYVDLGKASFNTTSSALRPEPVRHRLSPSMPPQPPEAPSCPASLICRLRITSRFSARRACFVGKPSSRST